MKKLPLTKLFKTAIRACLVSLMFCMTFISQATISIVNNAPCLTPMKSITSDENGLTVSYSFPEITKVTSQTSDSILFKITGFGFCNEFGKPKVPMKVDTYRIPDGYFPRITITPANPALTLTCNYIGVEMPEIDGDLNSKPIRTISPYSGNYPIRTAKILTTYPLRGENVVEITVSPVLYDYQNKVARIYENIEYRIEFVPEDQSDDQILPNQGWTATINEWNKIPISQPGDIMGVELSELIAQGNIGYLIVTNDKYLEQVNRFADWKRMLGYSTYVLSDENWGNSTNVRNTILNFRETHKEIKYLLIVGDNEDVPAEYSNIKYPHYTDVYYGTSSYGFIPDLYMGRIPVNNWKEADEVLTKLCILEMRPFKDKEFYKNAFHCAYFENSSSDRKTDTRRFVLTSEEIRNYMIEKDVQIERFYSAPSNADPTNYENGLYSTGDSIPSELRKPNFSWTYNPSDISSKIQNGCFYGLYRGHGTVTGWLKYNTSHFGSLENLNLLPTIFSITCKTGKFDENCFAEQLLKIPLGGASAVVAASENSYSGYNDSLAEGIFDAIWPEPGLIPKIPRAQGNTSPTPSPTYKLGEILAQGLFRMNEQYGTVNKTMIKYQYEIFHLFGDPSMDFFTEAPTEFSNLTIDRYFDRVIISTHGESGTIGIYDPISGLSARYNTDYINFPTSHSSSLIVTVTGHNKLPYHPYLINLPGIDVTHYPTIETCNFRNENTASVKINSADGCKNVELSIFDIYGRLICSRMIDSFDNETELPLHESKGVYIITLKSDGEIVDTKKIIK